MRGYAIGDRISQAQYGTGRTALDARRTAVQPLLQGAGAHARRIEMLDAFDESLYVFVGGHNVLTKGQVIYNGGCFAAQVAVFVNAQLQSRQFDASFAIARRLPAPGGRCP